MSRSSMKSTISKSCMQVSFASRQLCRAHFRLSIGGTDLFRMSTSPPTVRDNPSLNLVLSLLPISPLGQHFSRGSEAQLAPRHRGKISQRLLDLTGGSSSPFPDSFSTAKDDDDDSLLLPRGRVRRSSAAFPVCTWILQMGNFLHIICLSGGVVGLSGCLGCVVGVWCLGWTAKEGELERG